MSPNESQEPKFEYVYSESIINKIKAEFTHLGDKTYLDHTGTTLYSNSQIKTVCQNLTQSLRLNPHSESGSRLDDARLQVINFLGANPDKYIAIFNSGSTIGLKTVGEYFPWSKESLFCAHVESHTSSVGIREYAIKNGCSALVWKDEKELNDILQSLQSKRNEGCKSKNLFTFPAMSNFNGQKFDLSWIQKIQANPNNLVVLDSASYLSTCTFDFSNYSPDFMVLSFYKIFGYPTGLGCLIMRKDRSGLLEKTYFGGSTVEMYTVTENLHVPRKKTEDFFEDGTPNFLGIEAIKIGFQTIESITGGFGVVSEHTFQLAKHAYIKLSKLVHWNKRSVIKFYSQSKYESSATQGGIVNFNILDPSGQILGYSTFKRVAETENLVVRTGCFCNTGSCQVYLGLDDSTLKKHHAEGHVCGDNNDLVDGQPTGSIRVSFGYMSLREDVDRLVEVIQQYFIENQEEAADSNLQQSNNDIQIVGLYVYPVKSCRGMPVPTWPLTNQGLQFDRQWMIMEGSRVLTQKQEPLMAQIQTEIDLAAAGQLILTFPSLQPLNIPLHVDPQSKDLVEQDLCSGKICGEKIEGLDCGSEAGDWLEQALGRTNIRLVRGLKRFSKRKNGGSNSLANDSELLTLNVASIQSLLTKIRENEEKFGEGNLDLDLESLTLRFRGNMIIKGVGAFQEESWSKLSVVQSNKEETKSGEEESKSISFAITGPCKRCTMIGVEQNSGELSKEPLRSLATFRDRKFNFGVHTKVLKTGNEKLSVGDYLQTM